MSKKDMVVGENPAWFVKVNREFEFFVGDGVAILCFLSAAIAREDETEIEIAIAHRLQTRFEGSFTGIDGQGAFVRHPDFIAQGVEHAIELVEKRLEAIDRRGDEDCLLFGRSHSLVSVYLVATFFCERLLRLGVSSARSFLMRSRRTEAGSSVGSWGTSWPEKALASKA